MKKKLLLGAVFASQAVFAQSPNIPNLPAFSFPSLSTTQPLSVVDATGKLVGVLSQEGVAIQINGVVTTVPLTPYLQNGQRSATTLRWADSSGAYVSTDCSGIPLISSVLPGFRPSVVIRNTQGPILYIGKDGYGTRQYYNSYHAADSNGVPTAACNRPPSNYYYIQDAYPPESSVNLSQYYTEPLHIKY